MAQNRIGDVSLMCVKWRESEKRGEGRRWGLDRWGMETGLASLDVVGLHFVGFRTGLDFFGRLD